MSARLFLLNVGANCSHGNLRSPIFPDGHFELLPIPEIKATYCNTGLIPKYCDLFREHLIPKSYLERLAHNDPEFVSFTYGDYPTKSPRVSVLRYARSEDLLLFMARLVKYTADGKCTGEAGFYLVGFFELEQIIKNVDHPLNEHEMSVFGENAHVRRAMLSPKWYDGFWLFKGGHRSRRFKKAMPLDKKFCATMRDSYGEPWVWKNNRSDLQTIGSYTRSCRFITNRITINMFLAKLNEVTVA